MSLNLFGAIGSASEADKVTYKTSESQTVTSSTTLVDDDTLTQSLETSSTYWFQFEVFWSTNSTADFKFQPAFTGTSSAVYTFTEFSVPSSGASNTCLRETTQTALSLWNANGADGTHGFTRITGTIVTTATGTLKLQWAQSTSDAGTTKVLIGSRLVVRKLA